MFFTEVKLSRRIEELKDYRYFNRKPINEIYLNEDESKLEKFPPDELENKKKLNVGDFLNGRDRYFWVNFNIDVPVDIENDFLLLLKFGNGQPGNNKGIEAQCFINGEIYQGVDINHQEVFISNKYAGENIKVCLKIWTGLEEGHVDNPVSHKVEFVDSAYLHNTADKLYYYAINIFNTIKILNDNNTIKHDLLKLLNKSFNLIDWTLPIADEFYRSIELAHNELMSGLQKIEKHSNINITAIGHTHIDVVWLWRLKHTKEKSIRSFSTVLRLMDQYPDYVFLQTQPQLYEFVKEDYPEIYKKIQEKVSEGRWEADGGMWLEPDNNLPSGESLVRQLLFGKRFLKEEFNVESKYLWLPDVFGYSWALPQILKKSGIDMFMTTKISWNQYNRMPHDTFIWKGIDGSEVLTHFITTPSADANIGPHFYTYNGEIEPYTVQGVYDGYRDKNINNNLLISYGYGDGGGGVNRDMLESIKVINEIPGLPNIKTGRADEYFDNLKETFNETDQYVHVWDGELYLEYHRGTYTSQAKIKKWNRYLEILYKNAEFESVLSYIVNRNEYPQIQLNKGWKIILRSQFHDNLPGSSIKEVYGDTIMDYREAENLAKEAMNSTSEIDGFAISNPSAWKRNGLIDLQGINKSALTEIKKFYNVIETDNSAYIYVEDIEAMSIKPLEKDNEVISDSESKFHYSDNEVETPFYKIKWNDKGWIESIFDKEFHKEVIKDKEYGNIFRIYEDKPMNFDAWDTDIYYIEKVENLEVISVELSEINDLFITVTFIYKYNNSQIVQNMRLYNFNKRIDFDTTVDWNERQKLLKTEFNVDIRASEARYDIQFGNTTRPNNWNTSWDFARFESVGHQWADLSQKDYGVSLLNDSKYGYSIKDYTLQLSLLKSAMYPDKYADQGVHKFVYSLLPHKGDFVEGRVIQHADDLNNPLRVVKSISSKLEQIVSFDSEYFIVVDAIKKAEDDNSIIVRLHEPCGASQNVKLKLHDAFNALIETNLMEEEIGDRVELENHKINISFNPYEIKTFKLLR